MIFEDEVVEVFFSELSVQRSLRVVRAVLDGGLFMLLYMKQYYSNFGQIFFPDHDALSNSHFLI
jgi:hypothetical protein